MKKFNKTISVEVSVDTIANKLVESFKDDFKHKELVTESIIGTLLNENRLSDLYNTLNGYTNEINFEPGDIVHCTEQYSTHVLNDEGGYDRDYQKLGNVRVDEIDIHRKHGKLKVYYKYVDIKGTTQTSYKWVSHLNCSKIAIEELA